MKSKIHSLKILRPKKDILSQNFGAEDAERLTPFKDDKPKYAEIMPFQAGSDYFSSAMPMYVSERMRGKFRTGNSILIA